MLIEGLLRTDLAENAAQVFDGLGEQLGAGDAAGRAASEEMRFKRCEPVVVALDGIRQDVGDSALAFAGQTAVLLASGPVLDVEVNDTVAGREPAFPGVVTTEDKVRRIVDGAEAGASELAEDVRNPSRRIAVDPMLVFVDQPD